MTCAKCGRPRLAGLVEPVAVDVCRCTHDRCPEGCNCAFIFKAMDMEVLAHFLHESARAAVERQPTVATIPGPFKSWAEITESAREGRRVQARWLLERGLVNTDRLGSVAVVS